MATSLAFSKKVFTWSCITSWSKSHSYLLTYSRGHKCTFVLSQAESVLNLAVTLEAAKPSATEKLILSLFILYWTSLPLRSSSLLLLLQNLDWLLLMQYGNISNWWISLMLLPVLFLVWGAPRTPKTFPSASVVPSLPLYRLEISRQDVCSQQVLISLIPVWRGF